ncbi:MAG: respiratory nitrate reductase subunit gamma [Pseudomonadota bacterium]
MADFLNHFFFGIYPYICLAVLALGSIIRYDREPYSWRSGSSQLLRRRQLMAGSVLFHAGVLVIFLGHFFGLLTPIRVYEFFGVSHGAKQLLAIIVGGVAGALAFVGASLLLHRRLLDPRIRRTSSFADIGILFLLWLQLALGLATIAVSARHLDGHEMVKLMTWAQGIFTFRPDVAALMADAEPLFKAHIFLGLTIFLLFPFTRLVHMLSAPLRYIWRRGYQIVRVKGAVGARH